MIAFHVSLYNMMDWHLTSILCDFTRGWIFIFDPCPSTRYLVIACRKYLVVFIGFYQYFVACHVLLLENLTISCYDGLLETQAFQIRTENRLNTSKWSLVAAHALQRPENWLSTPILLLGYPDKKVNFWYRIIYNDKRKKIEIYI